MPVERSARGVAVLVGQEAHKHRLNLDVDEQGVFQLVKFSEAEQDGRQPRHAAHLRDCEPFAVNLAQTLKRVFA